MKVQHIDHVAITVSDLKRSLAWYRDVLGLERRHEAAWGDVPTMMCAGETCVALFPSDATDPMPVDVREAVSMRHFAFRWTARTSRPRKPASASWESSSSPPTTGSPNPCTSPTRTVTGSR